MVFRSRLLLLLLLAAAAGPSSAVAQSASARPRLHARGSAPSTVFIGLRRAQRLVAGGAPLLDARARAAYRRGHVPGAGSAPWQDFVDGPRSGRLTGDLARVGERLRRLGVSAARPVVVYGDWDAAWGEEGRLFWMLEYLGHPRVYIVRGGVAAYREAGVATVMAAPRPVPGDFRPRPVAARRATAAQLRRALGDTDLRLLDTRNRLEFAGAVLHGEARGGRIPGARHAPWSQVFDARGRLLDRRALRAQFRELGVGPESLVVGYCTGGIRSGFTYAVLRHLGHTRVQNYDGSWWEWASLADHPLEATLFSK